MKRGIDATSPAPHKIKAHDQCESGISALAPSRSVKTARRTSEPKNHKDKPIKGREAAPRPGSLPGMPNFVTSHALTTASEIISKDSNMNQGWPDWAKI